MADMDWGRDEEYRWEVGGILYIFLNGERVRNGGHYTLCQLWLACLTQRSLGALKRG